MNAGIWPAIGETMKAPVETCDVLLVGCLHLANPGRDMFNVAVDDVLARGRQAEIEELVARLARFRPDKLLLEVPIRDQDSLQRRYRRFLAEAQTDDRSEVAQIGFRLASFLGHQAVFGIDEDVPFTDDSLGALVQGDARHERHFAALTQVAQQQLAELQSRLESSSLGNVLRYLNQPEQVAAALVPYLRYITPIASPPNYAGPDSTAAWYQRNLRIYANLKAYSAAGQRVLALFGAGHIPLLAHFCDHDPTLVRVDALPYL